jgi:hypothetical protein
MAPEALTLPPAPSTRHPLLVIQAKRSESRDRAPKEALHSARGPGSAEQRVRCAASGMTGADTAVAADPGLSGPLRIFLLDFFPSFGQQALT